MADCLRYKVLRFYCEGRRPRVVKRGLTLGEARAHCSRPDTMRRDKSGRLVWFDGFAVQGD